MSYVSAIEVAAITPEARELYIELERLPWGQAGDVKAGAWDQTAGLQLVARLVAAHGIGGAREAYPDAAVAVDRRGHPKARRQYMIFIVAVLAIMLAGAALGG